MYLQQPAFADLELNIKPMSECFPDAIFKASGGWSGKRLGRTQIALPRLITSLDGQVCLGEGVRKAVQIKRGC